MATRSRRGFDPNSQDSIADAVPRVLRTNACFADGCLLPGSMNAGGTSWACAWHYGALPSDIPRITRVLQDWDCITGEIARARRVLSGQFASDPKALNQLFTEAINRLRPAVAAGGWGDQFERKAKESYRDWMYSLEKFLAVRVAEATSTYTSRA